MLLCVGAEGSGKTLLLRRLQTEHKNALRGIATVDASSAADNCTVPTSGVNITRLLKPAPDKNRPNPEITVRELGKAFSI